MDQHLGVALDSLVKLVVRDLGVIDADLMTDHERRFRLSSDDQITQISVVLFDIALSLFIVSVQG
jgi:hypothetical protein